MITGWATQFPWGAIKAAASDHRLDPLLVAAFVGQESSGVAARTRYEKAYRWLVKPEVFAASLGISLETEMIAQMHSYGLMQVMGGTARSLGYIGYLSELIDVGRGLDLGCHLLADLTSRYKTPDEVIAAYNAGTPRHGDDGRLVNQAYVDGVTRKYNELKADAAKQLA